MKRVMSYIVVLLIGLLIGTQIGSALPEKVDPSVLTEEIKFVSMVSGKMEDFPVSKIPEGDFLLIRQKLADMRFTNLQWELAPSSPSKEIEFLDWWTALWGDLETDSHTYAITYSKCGTKETWTITVDRPIIRFGY